MRLFFKQRFTFGIDVFEIYNETDEVVFTVKSRFSFGRKLEIYDRIGNLVGTLIGRVFTFLPTFEMYVGDSLVGRIKKKMTFFKPKFILDCNCWEINGTFWEWEYSIVDSNGEAVAALIQEFNSMDTYILDIVNDSDTLAVLMTVIVIDAEMDSRR